MAATAPGRGRLRRAVALVHRWLGLALGVLVAFVGLTGSLIVFQPEIDRWLAPALHRVEPGAPVSLDQMLATATAAHPGGPPGFVNLRLPREPGQAASVLMKDRFGPGSQPFQEAFVDPGSARLLGVRAPEDRLVGFLIGLHAHLLVGDHSWGETAVGFLGIALILFCASGLYMWWPRRGGLRGAVTVRAGQGSYWFNYDLHKLAGALMVVPLLASGLTGLVLVFPGYVRPPLKAVMDTPPPPRAPRSEAVAGVSPIAVDHAVAIALATLPDAVPTMVQVPQGPAANGTIQVRLRRPDDRRQHYADGGAVVHVDRFSGAVRAVFRSEERPVGGRLLHEWILPTHTGEIAGLAGRVLMCLAGLAPALLFGTGLFLWLRRRRARRQRRSARMAGAVRA
ncbi:putative iron-regulated membrane protein [Stella humosa]|uniref:Putative iron-regulated membrane protein n=1 Tax=Stella humosa TaxID=94 RepID=A0A3N1LK09_9PROT|nr:PepSY-associated TM helix domain-containing protein [Stella humosa]ROP90766.1 putative iron-regulated membrane protein [Stella humosa]BBK34888.1 hypothetical protein STHU_55220 [Stella humosa]